MPVTQGKVCSVCGRDVSTEKRTKDSTGKYFCQPCYASAAARTSAVRPSSTSTVPPRPAEPPPVASVIEVRPNGKSTDAALPPAGNQKADPNALQPGEFDAFLDPAIVGLLRHQVEPEVLLGVCDVKPPVGAGAQTILLTPTKLVFVTLRTQGGQSEVAPGRQIALADLEQTSLKTARSSTWGRERFNLQLATRDRIENWTSEYSALRRIGSAITDLKVGRQVESLIRTTADLAAMRARAPKSVRSRRPTVMWMAYWLDRLVIPPLRVTRSRVTLSAVWVGMVSLVIAAGWVSVTATLIDADNILGGKWDDVLDPLLTALISFVVFSPALANVLCCSTRLKAFRAGNDSPMLPMQRPSPSGRRLPVPWTKVVRIAGPLVAGIAVAIWMWPKSSPRHSLPSFTGSSNTSSDAAVMPTITVTGNDASLVTFTDWRVDVSRVTGTVKYKGDSGVELHYRVTEDGVLKDTGVITPPTGGEMIMSHEAMSIYIQLPSPPTPATQIEVQAIGG